MKTTLALDPLRLDGHRDAPPKWIIIGMNNVCNLHCKMCDVGLGDPSTMFWANLIGDHPQNMTLVLFQEILAQAALFQPKPRIGLAFTEPLIHPYVLDFCRAAVSMGFYLSLTSNGVQLPRYADALVEIGIDEIAISIDGPAAVHNQIRGGRETFQKLYRGLELLNAAKQRTGKIHPEVSLVFCVTDLNYRHIFDFVQEVEPLHPARIVITQLNFIDDEMAYQHNTHYGKTLPVVRSNLGNMQPALFDTQTIYDELGRVRDLLAQQENPPELSLSPEIPDLETLNRYYRTPQEFVGGRRCTDPWKMMMVKTDGSVIPAHGRCFNTTVGNINEQPLTEIWNNNRYVDFRQTLHAADGTLPACARCCGVIGKPA